MTYQIYGPTIETRCGQSEEGRINKTPTRQSQIYQVLRMIVSYADVIQNTREIVSTHAVNINLDRR